MPPTIQTPNARISFGEIMRAVEDKLVAGAVAKRAQITWGTPQNVPQLSGPQDVLLVARNARHGPYDGGAADFRLHRMLDIWVRSLSLLDAGGGYKSTLIEMFETGDAVLNAVGFDDWWPTDASGNLLTIESVKMVGDVAPDYPTKGSAYGDWVATLEFVYFCKINPGAGL